MSFILSAMAPPPPERIPTRVPVRLVWTGWDGSEWDLTQGPVRALLNGIEGLHFPEHDEFSSESQSVHGQRFLGWRAKAREVFMRVAVGGDTSSSWLDVADRFFRSLHPALEGVLTVTAGTRTRRLRLRRGPGQIHQYERDPYLSAWAEYGITLVADQPFWEGNEITGGPWRSPDPVPFFPETGAPPFYISRAIAFGSTVISNPGDVDGFPVWTVRDALAGISLGIGDRLIEVPFGTSDGDVLRINTDPRKLSATLNGDNAARQLGFQRFAPVPPGSRVPVHVAAAGTGSVSVSLVPLFFRAF